MTSHIRIPDVSPVVQAVADGAKSVFSFPFPIFKASDLEVRSNSTLVTTGYSVVGEGSSTGGAVIFTNVPEVGARITLRRKQTYARTDDFLDERAPTPHELNDAVDQNVAAIQELAEQVSRAVTRPLSANLSAPVDLSLPDPVAGKVIGWSKTANALVNLDTEADIPVGKVQVDKDDSPNYLETKLAAGSNITVTKNTDKMTIAVSGLGSAATMDVGTSATDVVQLDALGKLPAVDGSQLTNIPVGKVQVDANDTPAFLETKLAAGSNITVTKNTDKMTIAVSGLGSAATMDVGTASDNVAAGNHDHAGVYEPVNANIVKKNVPNTYTAPQTPSAQTLTDAETVNIAITSQVWILTTSGNRQMGAPTGGVDNTFYFLKIVTNGFTPTWHDAFDFGDAGIPANLTGTCGFDIVYDGSKYRISTRFIGGA